MPDPLLPAGFVAQLPKAELHLHLEGSLQPDTLRELARRRGLLQGEIERWTAEQQRRGYRFSAFLEFVEAFKFVTQLLAEPEDYALATTRLLEQLAAENVKYAEVTLSAGVILWKGQPLDAVYEAIWEATLEAQARLGLRVNWIFDAVRQFGTEPAREVMQWAARYRSRGVVAFGLGGDEERGPATLFPEVYREARERGLHLLAHAGETAGAESVRQAVELLGAERIGHGLAAADSGETCALLRDRTIPLEVCPSSNVAMGLIPEFRAHPMPVFLEAGVKVTLSSDDPALFGTSLEREYRLAAQEFSLSREQLVQLARNGVEAAFLSEGEKRPHLEQIGRSVSAWDGERTG